MASIINRSNYVVSVRNRDDLTRTFPHDKPQGAKDYCAQLRAQQFRPRVEQLGDTFFVRVGIPVDRDHRFRHRDHSVRYRDQ